MIKKATLVVMSYVALHALAQPSIDPILGIKLGHPLKGQFLGCAIRNDNWCRTSQDDSSSSLFINPPDIDSPTGVPTWVKRSRILIDANGDGLIDMFRIESQGPRVQERVIESIRGRLGEPYSYKRSEAQTNMGVKVEIVYAAWKNDQIAVTHVCTSINSCSVTFYTAERYKKHLELMEQRMKRDKL